MGLYKYIALLLASMLIGCAQGVSTYQLVGGGHNGKLLLSKGYYTLSSDEKEETVSKTGTYTLHGDTLYFKPMMLKIASEKDTIIDGKKLTMISCARGELDSTIVKGYISGLSLRAFGNKYIHVKGRKPH